MRMVRAAAVLSIFGLALIAAVLVIRDDAKRVSLGSVASFWGTGAPGWWSKIPVVGGSGLPAVKFDGIPVEGLASPPMQRQAVVVHAAPPYHAWYVRHTGVCRTSAALVRLHPCRHEHVYAFLHLVLPGAPSRTMITLATWCGRFQR